MQQVFSLVNSLLSRDAATAKKRLRVRQYRVVPLSQRSGVLEWCQNTMPLSVFLIGGDNCSGAHAKYHPRDLTAKECRTALSVIQKKRASPKDRVEVKLYLNLSPFKELKLLRFLYSPSSSSAPDSGL